MDVFDARRYRGPNFSRAHPMSSSYQPRVVLFVDICGSTQLYDTMGDAAAAKNIANCLATLQERVEEAGGRVMQRVGDELMCLFETADAALDAARIMQEWVTRQEALGQSTIAVRVGCHFGPVIDNSGDLFGDSVNVAARVAAMANSGQVLTTEDTVAALSGPLRDKVRVLGRFTIRGKREDVTIYELLWQDIDYQTSAGTHSGIRFRPTRIILKYAGREIHLGSGDRTSLIVGRDVTCDIVIPDAKASRRHARIETRRDRFVLIDQSVNGTYVRIGNEEIPLLREELILYSQGQISFGRRSESPDRSVIEFVCE
jgi:adenylate cyclase